jgi:hypothetical protein
MDGDLMEYKCSKCGADNCKLWRDYDHFFGDLNLYCAPCAAEDQKKDIQSIDTEGCRSSPYGRTDQIGWLVPAVPYEDTFWGYASVPDERVEWWKKLPTLPSQVLPVEVI